MEVSKQRPGWAHGDEPDRDRGIPGAAAGPRRGWGVAAGLVFAAVTMWFAHSTGGKAEMPLRMISTIVKGDQAMAAGTTSPALGAVVHLVLSALFGVVFVLAVPRFRTNGTVALAGTAYGLLLYVVNFLVLTPLVVTTFRMANSPSRCSPTWYSAPCCRLRSSGRAYAAASPCRPSSAARRARPRCPDDTAEGARHPGEEAPAT